MNIKTIAYTNEGEVFDVNAAETFSGKQAGICYMKDKYAGNVTDPTKAHTRFLNVVQTGHHSIADHVYVTVLIENTSKMMAMLINSIQCYNTSEKSGRYTNMANEDKTQVELYNKWLGIFKQAFLKDNPMIDEKLAEKLAMENARMVLSIFTRSITMSYTASLRVWNYLYHWCVKLITVLDRSCKNKYFAEELKKDLFCFADFIKGNLYIEGLKDIKDGGFDFILNLTNSPIKELAQIGYENYDVSYTTTYNASFPAIAQLMRHRTIKYNIYIPFNNFVFYVPEIIRGTDYAKEWVTDLKKIKDCIPQATFVNVIERGTIENFILKGKERLCGRTQEETRMIMANTFKNYAKSLKNGSTEGQKAAYDIISKYTDPSGRPLLKCEMLGGCKEPCIFKKSVIESFK